MDAKKPNSVMKGIKMKSWKIREDSTGKRKPEFHSTASIKPAVKRQGAEAGKFPCIGQRILLYSLGDSPVLPGGFPCIPFPVPLMGLRRVRRIRYIIEPKKKEQKKWLKKNS